MRDDGATQLPANWIETLLPHIDFRERHRIDILAPPGFILDCVDDYRLKNDPLVRAAIALRELPARMLGRTTRPPFDRDDFTFLGRDRDNALAFGLIGAFWEADYGLLPCPSVEDFRVCARQDVCKLVLSYTLRPLTRGTHRLTTETSVFCPTPATRRRFAPYWYLIRPVSGLIRRRMLASVRAQVESRARSRSITD
ncbi:hypothetical protein [Brytella acorum]|uniref:DUF2867 domain-containing protein n=1 Tax=Brytella acorum TaxID=2959299 RepID=A0AA35UQS2_9PROT|nr:hypothetical protein [Brytella acorum]MDF3625535.1 hypothetical protein [Brytella acorum]CAI9120390.1 hypothetical protein LMG32879_001222 [Brytella acorum]